MSASSSSAQQPLKLKFKLSTTHTNNSDAATADETHVRRQSQSPRLIGARGGVALKDLLSTAPNPEVAIRGFQDAHGLTWTSTATATAASNTPFAPAMQLLDLLAVPRSRVFASLLESLKSEMLLRIAELPQHELQRVLEATFPYIEFRELRAIPIAVLARQDETPAMYLRELTENRRILHELPVHVRRKILHVDPQELHVFVEACTHEYVEQMAAWYVQHPLDDPLAHATNPNSHVDASAAAAASATSATRMRSSRWGVAPEERRRSSPALAKLTAMIGDSEVLYRATIDILKDYVVAANIPGSAAATMASPKEYVDYVPFLGALRADLANLQRDRTTALLRVDPVHKFIWFLDRALKQQTIELTQLFELLAFLAKLRIADLPANKKFNKKSSTNNNSSNTNNHEQDDDAEHFEVVLGPPPIDELLAVLDRIGKVDTKAIFAEPVPADVPTYRDVIRDPMDLSTMRKKAKRGKYKSVEAFKDDFNLMIRNCMTFNPDSTVFYKEGKRVGKRGLELIDKNVVALRGEPQRIRAKKRRKVISSASASTNSGLEAVSMLTSAGAATLRDFGDVDQSGMVAEGLCDELLADAAMVLADPPVKQLLCDALWKHLAQCYHKREMPTDSLACRGLVQLLQIGNAASVRRMIRKRDFVLRAPQVVTMRVVLPLLLRALASHRLAIASGFPVVFARDLKLRESVADAALWDHVLRASSAIRTMTKALAVQCLVDNHVEFAATLMQFVLVAEDDALLRDRPFLHAVADVVLDQIKAVLSSVTTSSDHSDNAAVSLFDRIKALSVWKLVVRDFFVAVLEQRIRAMHASTGSVVVLADAADAAVHGDDGLAAEHATDQTTVQSFPAPVFHEKVAMVLVAVLHLVEKAASTTTTATATATTTNATTVSESDIAPLVKRTLGVLRSCCASLREFELLWTSTAFRNCRVLYEQLLAKCPLLRDELFRAVPTAAVAGADTDTTVATGELDPTTTTSTSAPVAAQTQDSADATEQQHDDDKQANGNPAVVEHDKVAVVQNVVTQEVVEQEQDVAKQVVEQKQVAAEQTEQASGQTVEPTSTPMSTGSEMGEATTNGGGAVAASGATNAKSLSDDEEGEVEEGEERDSAE